MFITSISSWKVEYTLMTLMRISDELLLPMTARDWTTWVWIVVDYSAHYSRSLEPAPPPTLPDLQSRGKPPSLSMNLTDLVEYKCKEHTIIIMFEYWVAMVLTKCKTHWQTLVVKAGRQLVLTFGYELEVRPVHHKTRLEIAMLIFLVRGRCLLFTLWLVCTSPTDGNLLIR